MGYERYLTVHSTKEYHLVKQENFALLHWLSPGRLYYEGP